MDSDREGHEAGSSCKRTASATGFSQTACHVKCTTASAAMAFCRKRSAGSAWYWKKFDVVQGDDIRANLKCRESHEELNPANPSNLSESHFNGDRCGKRRRIRDGKMEVALASASNVVNRRRVDICCPTGHEWVCVLGLTTGGCSAVTGTLLLQKRRQTAPHWGSRPAKVICKHGRCAARRPPPEQGHA
eukprot:363789-Chlamydomonas_euryale.AAC.10